MINFWKGVLPEKIIITPIPALTKSVGKELEMRKNIRGTPWWSAIKGYYRGKEICIVNCGTGALAGDCVLFLAGEENIKELIFAGLAGSVGDKFSPGDVCGLKEYGGGAGFIEFLESDFPKNIPKTALNKFDNGGITPRSASVYTTPSLFREKEIFDALGELGFDLIDMETAFVIPAAAREKIKLSFVYYVSDYRLTFQKIKLKTFKDICLRSA